MPAFRSWGLERSRGVVTTLREIASEHSATAAQVALAWVLTVHKDLILAIPGASRVRQAEENAGAMDLALTEGEVARLEERSRAFV